MPSQSPKLNINYYIESGCLGAQGEQKIQHYCQFLTQKLQHIYNDFCTWHVKPLSDLHQPHIQYFIAHKKLSDEQATRYLNALQKNKKKFESQIDDIVIHSIEDYMGR